MSGKKKILVDESEWYSAKRAAQQLRQVKRDIPRLIDEVRRATEADHARTRAEAEERSRRTEQALAGLGEQTRRLEADTDRRLREQNDRLRRELHDSAERLALDTRAQLAEQRAALERGLAAEGEARRRDVAALTGRLDDFAGDRDRAAGAARQWLADGDTMAALIADTLPHERHAPGRLDRLRLELATARRTHDAGQHEAALSGAQRAYLDLSELRLDIERLELERRLAQETATDALIMVETLIAENAVMPVAGPDGQPLPGYELDVDHWSEGELGELRAVVAERLTRARDEATPAGEQRELAALAADLELRLREIMDRADMRLFASQLRVNLADSVAQTLTRIGAYELADGEYQDADERRSYHARLEHMNGNQIVVEILPAPDDGTGHVLRVLSYDYDTASEHELQDRIAAVREALEADGHRTGEPEREPGVPEPEARDLERHRQARRAGGQRPAAGGAG
ncbi:hypothetical protein SRB5_51130 [Streptomyces sp. RB5]|uniref:Uncharacterized protein n=1 Tax=Streptomyces smaragdinus TaxID=2585196 RepID=A0A7K0CN67_9ACTN|nr:hypothetical protein [Streptomyces smaragdinus]MQY14937.1 hypothetical protein [Streptomyces smaragdinus]